jgi:molybdopterin-guanine dinucleotide biosynthesis protein A
VPQVSAIVLAGGKSERLGQDKALLKLDGNYLLRDLLHDLATLSDDLLVVADDIDRLAQFGVRVVPDARPGMGPIGGIHAGLQAMRHFRGVFVGCDMPLLNLPLLRHMAQLSSDFDVVIPRVVNQVEPLHAVYSKVCLQPMEAALERGERRVISFFSQVLVRYVEKEEIERFDPQHLSFFNINTPDDLTQVRRLRGRCHCDWKRFGGVV